jgi:hypothetical protein
MPKSTHQHQKEAVSTDRKFRPDDEAIYEREKQEFQASEQAKKPVENDPESQTIPGEKENEE